MSLKYEEKVDHKLNRLKNKIEQIERDKFHKTFPKDPKLLYQELSKYKSNIEKLRKKNKGPITDVQYNLIFPASQETHSDRFDPILLHLLLIKFCGYQKPCTGWHNEPDINDRSENANLVRLKRGRNEISHLPKAEKTDKVYKDLYQKLKRPFKDLGCTNTELHELLPKSVRFKFFNAVISFTGRNKELQNIHKEMESLHNIPGLVGLVISGLAGLGKSQLAKKYFEIHSNLYDNNVVWIDATSLKTSFQNLGETLQLNVKDDKGNFKSIEIIIQEVHTYFSEDTILFIFDNADFKREDIAGSTKQSNIQEEILRYLPSSPKTFNLITSQNISWSQQFKKISLNAFTKEDATTFVLKELHLNQTTNVINEILERFGYHSLALQQFITYIQETKISFCEYLNLMKSLAVLLVSDTNFNVLGAIKVNIQKMMEENNELAVSIFNVMRSLNGKEIHRGFFLVLRFGDKIDIIQNDLKVNQSLRILQKYSMITLTSANTGDSKDDIITVHSLVQETIKCIQKNNNNEFVHFKFLLDQFVQDEDKEHLYMKKINFKDYGYWIEQFIYIFKTTTFREEFIEMCSTNAYFLTDVFNSKCRLKIWGEVLFELLTSLENLVHVDEQSTLINIKKKLKCLFSSKHSEIVNHYYRMIICQANVFGLTGNYTKALSIIKKCKEKHYEKLDPMNVDCLKSELFHVRYLAHSHSFKECLQMSEQLLHKQIKIFDKKHPETLQNMKYLALCRSQCGNNASALELFDIVLKEQLSIYDDFHPEINDTKNDYGLIISDNNKALVILQEAMHGWMQIYDHNHTEIFTTKSNIALILSKKGELEQSIKLFQELLSEQLKFYTEDHRNVLYTKYQIAYQLAMKGEAERSLKLFLIVLDGFLNIFDENHSNVIATKERIKELKVILL